MKHEDFLRVFIVSNYTKKGGGGKINKGEFPVLRAGYVK